MDPNVKYLTDEEIKQFMKELDFDNDRLIEYHEVEAKLDEVSKEIGWNVSVLFVTSEAFLMSTYSTRTRRT